MPFANKVQLITYPDSLGGNLVDLRELLSRHFADCFPGGIHVLPPFPSSGDRGFAPITYDRIDPHFGSWEDLAALGEIGPVMLDLMVNHVSRQSAYFQDFLAKGAASKHAQLFLDPRKVWPEGEPEASDLAKLFLRRPRPYSEYELATGERARVWTTFGHNDPSEQIDLDFDSPAAMQLVMDTIAALAGRGVSALRLDAVGYIIKRRGTSCFFVEPEIWETMGRFREAAEAAGLNLLPEVHAPLEIRRKLSERGYWSYDFVLPFLVLSALLERKSTELARYLRDRPHNLITMLDCHDGIPVKPDLDGFIDEAAARRIVETCVDRGARLSRINSAAREGDTSFDVHQIACTYYSALGADDDAYVTARALQLFSPGVPQVYYVGLLAGENDYEGAERAQDRRALNRRNYDAEQVEREVERPVVQRLLRLIRFRNECPAFDGSFSVAASGPTSIELGWEMGGEHASLFADLASGRSVVRERRRDGTQREWEA